MSGNQTPQVPVRIFIATNDGTVGAALQHRIEGMPGVSVVMVVGPADLPHGPLEAIRAGARIPQPIQVAALSAREREVFRLLATGPSNRELSRSLGIRERTVKAHIGSILAKLGLESRLQVGLAALLYHAESVQPTGPRS